LKSDEPVMLDGMRFADVKKEFAVPVYAHDLDSLAGVFESGSASAGLEALGNSSTGSVRGNHVVASSSF